MTQIGHLYYQMPADFHLYGPSKCLITLRKDDAKAESVTGWLNHFTGLRHLSVWWVFLAKQKSAGGALMLQQAAVSTLWEQSVTQAPALHTHNEGTNGSTGEGACRHPEENASFCVALNMECCCCHFIQVTHPATVTCQCSYRGHSPQRASDNPSADPSHRNGHHNPHTDHHHHDRAFHHSATANHNSCSTQNHSSSSQGQTWTAQGQRYGSVAWMFALLSSWLTALLKFKEQDIQLDIPGFRGSWVQ